MPANEARFNDAYAVLVSECKVIEDYVRREGIRSVLEFGPGRSTLMFAAAGCEIWTAECHEYWLKHYQQLFADEPAIHIVRFENASSIRIPELEGKRFELAFIDSPAGHEFPPGMSSRLNSCEFAAQHTDRLLLHDAERPGEQATIVRMQDAGWRMDGTWFPYCCYEPLHHERIHRVEGERQKLSFRNTVVFSLQELLGGLHAPPAGPW